MQRSAAIDKEQVDNGLKENRKDLRHFRKILSGVDAFLKAKFPQDASL